MIKKTYNLLRSNQFTYATIWMTVGGMFANAGSFFYIFLMVHLLSPSDYATLVTLQSVINLLIVPATILQIAITTMVAEAKGKNELGKVSYIYYYFMKRLVILGILFLVILILFHTQINSYLHITNPWLVIIGGIAAIGYFFLTVARSILQGMSAFQLFSLSTITEMFSRLFFAATLTLSGMGLLGAMYSLILSEAIVTVVTVKVVLKRFIKGIEHMPIHVNEIVRLTLPTVFILFGLTSFYTTDVLLVKHYFPENVYGNIASLYSGVSTMGKIIFFGVSGVASAILPIATERYAAGSKTSNLLYASFGLVSLGAILLTAMYFLFPQYILTILGKAEYIQAAPYLGLFAIFISLHALVFLLANFLLSIRVLVIAYAIPICALIQIGGIVIYHQSLYQVIHVSIFSAALLLLLLLLLYVVRARANAVQ